MNDHYFFVTSTESVYDRVLPLIEEKAKTGKVYIYTITEDLTQFFKTYTSYPTVKLTFDASLVSRRAWYKLYSSLKKFKRSRRCWSVLEGNNIYFFTDGNYIALYALIQSLAKKNQVYYCNSGKYDTGRIRTGIISKLESKIVKSLLGIDTFMAGDGNLPYPHLARSYFEKNSIVSVPHGKINSNLRENLAQHIYEKIIELKGKEVLFIEEPQDIIERGRIDDAELSASSDMLYDMLNKHWDKIVVKEHQKKFDGYGKMKTFDTVPNFIPAEFILRHPWKLVIGIESTSLSSATHFSNAEVISLIDMFCYEDEEVYENLKKFLTKESNGKILFPKSIAQLEEMLE